MEEENKLNQEEKSICDKVLEHTEDKIEQILNEGIRQDTVDYLYKLVDIHKDIKNEIYWKEKIEMRYRESMGNYGEDSYGRRGVPGTGRGRYREGSYNDGSYGRRGVPGTGRSRGRYRGEDMIDEMAYHYGNYNEGVENYGGDSESDKSFDKMAECMETFIYTIMEEADEPMKKEKIKKIARKVAEM